MHFVGHENLNLTSLMVESITVLPTDKRCDGRHMRHTKDNLMGCEDRWGPQAIAVTMHVHRAVVTYAFRYSTVFWGTSHLTAISRVNNM